MRKRQMLFLNIGDVVVFMSGMLLGVRFPVHFV